MSHTRNRIALLLILGPAVLLAGCGGGGGCQNNCGGTGRLPQTYDGSITGKVVDTSGNPVATAVVLLDSTTQQANTQEATTITQGGYVINSVTPGLHTIFVSTTVGGQTYTGSTQVELQNEANNSVTNANVIVSLPTQQATVSGVVTDSTNNNAPVANAEVFFQSPLASSDTAGLTGSSSPLSTASLAAYTASNGTYTITLPVYQGTGTTARAYTATAGYRTGDPTASFADATPRSLTFTAGQVVANENFALALAGSASSATPTINDVEAITQPLDPAFYTPSVSGNAAAAGSAESSSVYEQLHRLLSPHYARLIAEGHAAAQVKHLASAVRPRVSPDASQYGVEMDVFFSLPGDAAGTSAAVRQQLSGFQISTDAADTNGQTGLIPLDFLQDPLANYYDYQDIASAPLFFADTQYNFGVQSYASDGKTAVGAASADVTAAPLSFVNMVQPADPLYNNQTIGTLSATNPVLQWTVYDPLTQIHNENIGDYYVFLYSTFPGVTSNPIYTSGALSVSSTYNTGTSMNSFTIPTSGNGSVALTSGHEYWVVVAATASSNPSSAATALSLSQITPFTAQ